MIEVLIIGFLARVVISVGTLGIALAIWKMSDYAVTQELKKRRYGNR